MTNSREFWPRNSPTNSAMLNYPKLNGGLDYEFSLTLRNLVD
jgi:hypothetical protein